MLVVALNPVHAHVGNTVVPQAHALAQPMATRQLAALPHLTGRHGTILDGVAVVVMQLKH